MKNVAIVGAGYVGLTTGAALAYIGHRVTVLDVDEAKVEGLRKGIPPFFEPHLGEMLRLVGERMGFTTRYGEAIPQAEVVFLTAAKVPLNLGKVTQGRLCGCKLF
ncbi:NAD-binding protein [Thermus caliditerrae]|uniref:NAD-binding protein n=1 Tax=Thermus caliditerrae TaxID=1330700 RepID=UPI0005717214|nr:3-hydroxyacyl-CoA dehydrogenase NAD-binding domain-containing protein [Thermus caliditerrae]